MAFPLLGLFLLLRDMRLLFYINAVSMAVLVAALVLIATVAVPQWNFATTMVRPFSTHSHIRHPHTHHISQAGCLHMTRPVHDLSGRSCTGQLASVCLPCYAPEESRLHCFTIVTVHWVTRQILLNWPDPGAGNNLGHSPHVTFEVRLHLSHSLSLLSLSLVVAPTLLTAGRPLHCALSSIDHSWL